MALNWDKYDIEVRNDDAIERNQVFFDFMPLNFNNLDGLYLRERCLLEDAIMKYQLRKQSAKKNLKTEQRKKFQKQRKGRYI